VVTENERTRTMQVLFLPLFKYGEFTVYLKTFCLNLLFKCSSIGIIERNCSQSSLSIPDICF
jgi:hypothetical protein